MRSTRNACRAGVLAVTIVFGFAPPVVIARQPAQAVESVVDLLREANDLGDQRRFAEAIALAERAVAVSTVAEANEATLADALSLLGGLAFAAQDYKRASDAYSRELTVRQRTGDSNSAAVARVLGQLGNAKRGLGQIVEAKDFLQRALAIQRTLVAADDLSLADAELNLGSLLESLGDRTGAESLIVEGVRIYDSRSEGSLSNTQRANKAVAFNALGLLYFRALDYEKAEGPFRRSLALREQNSQNPDVDPLVARATANLAAVYQERGQFDQAEPLYRRILAIYDKVPNPPQTTVATTLKNFAMIHMLRGRPAEAEAAFARALTIRESVLGARHPEVASTLEAIAIFDQNSGRAADALRAIERATSIHEDNLRSVLMSGSDQQRQAYMTTVQENFDIALSMRASLFADRSEASAWAASLVMRRKGRVLDAAATMTERLASRMTTEERALFDRLAAARAQLAALVLQSTEAGAGEREAARRRLEGDIDGLETSLASRSREFAAELRQVDEAAVREQLPTGTALVEFVRYLPFNPKVIGRADKFGAPRYAAFILTRDSEPKWFELGPAEPIEKSIRAFRDGLRVPSSSTRRTRGIAVTTAAGVGTTGRELGRLLLDPMQAALANVERILVAPDGELSVIPFAALQVANWQQPSAPPRYLVEQAEIDYLTSGRDLVSRPERTTTSAPALIVANPRFNAGPAAAGDTTFQPLAGTADEANALRALIPNAQVLTGAAATEHALKTAKGPRVLHVATHGFFLNGASTPAATDQRGGVALAAVDAQSVGRQALLRSGLALAGANQRQGGDGEDGLLTALEAASLDLRGTQLVVLSACDTGLGEVRSGDGVYGLRRALTIAGAETQVMSLWQVSDRATRDLMIAYYKQLSSGAGRAAALRNVQRQLLQSREWSHPYYWAAFVVAGDWTPLRN